MPTTTTTTSKPQNPPEASPAPPTQISQTLAHIGALIESEVEYWMYYIKEIHSQPSFATLTSSSTPASSSSSATKVAALRHILETLPLRHTALMQAYNGSCYLSSTDDPTRLSDQLTALLEELKKDEQQKGDENKPPDLELGDWFDYKLFKSKRFRPDVVALEEEVTALEMARMDELKGLMAVLEDLRILDAERVLEGAQVRALVEAMDEVGLGGDNSSVVRGRGEVNSATGEGIGEDDRGISEEIRVRSSGK